MFGHPLSTVSLLVRITGRIPSKASITKTAIKDRRKPAAVINVLARNVIS
jgi:hypothetical protein